MIHTDGIRTIAQYGPIPGLDDVKQDETRESFELRFSADELARFEEIIAEARAR